MGLACGFAAVVPIDNGAGWLIVAQVEAGRLTPKVVQILGDIAQLAEAVVTPTSRASDSRGPRASTVVRGAVRPRAAAQHMIETALRRRRNGPLGLLLLDVDRFRSINDALGAIAGDALLAVIGARLQQVLASGGVLLRLEGDRFVIVAPGDADMLSALARRLLAVVRQPLVLDGRSLRVQASVGVIAGAIEDLTATDLLAQAEVALRRAKAEGRDRFVLQEPADAAAAFDGSRLEFDLAHALGEREMYLVYQPYIDLATRRVAGFETLLRWRHPVRGEMNPAAFIAAAEASGLIVPLGDWVLRTALANAARWPSRLSLAVNISPLQFHQPGFLASIDQALAESGVDPARLELEITETVLMRDNPETTTLLRALIARGVRIALDDFGTGYSALAYLGRLPHHRIKLDKAFVQDLENPATRELIRAIIALARSQGIAITAEGVERPEHVARVTSLGFTHAQGYATGLPVAVPDGYFEAPTPSTAQDCEIGK